MVPGSCKQAVCFNDCDGSVSICTHVKASPGLVSWGFNDLKRIKSRADDGAVCALASQCSKNVTNRGVGENTKMPVFRGIWRAGTLDSISA
eukprot:4889239-Prymnesium_polylepis.1